MPEDLLTDGVWSALDPTAGRLTAGAARRWWATIAVAVVVTMVIVGFWWSGLLLPRLRAAESGSDTDTQARTFTYVLHLHNDGLTPIVVSRVGRDGPGLKLRSVATTPMTISSGGTVDVALSYEVTDCAAVPTARWPIPVQVKRPWGHQSVDVQQPLLTSPYAPAGPDEDQDPSGRPWQEMLAGMACNPEPSGTK